MRITNFKFGFQVLGLTFFLSVAANAADRLDPKFYGDYVGLSTTAMQDGAPFEEAVLQVFIDSEGIHRRTGLKSKNAEVLYSPKWLLDAKKSEIFSDLAASGEALAILQSIGGELAASIFTYIPADLVQLERARVDLVEFLGEGIPAVLAVYRKRDTNGDSEAWLRATYATTLAAAEVSEEEQNPSTNYLLPVNFKADLTTLKSAVTTLEAKKDVLHRAGLNLWMTKPGEISDRLNLFKFAIQKSESPLLILEALRKSISGGDVSGMVPIVVSAVEASLNRIKNHQPYANEIEIQYQSVLAAASMLFSAHTSLSVLEYVQSKFGRTNVKAIRATHQRILAEDAEYLERLAQQQEGNGADWEYSREDFVQLLTVMNKVRSQSVQFPSPLINSWTLKTVERALSDYSSLQVCTKALSAL